MSEVKRWWAVRGRTNYDEDRAEVVRWDDYAALAAERDAYKRAKAENDERFLIERDQARAEAAALAARVAEMEVAERHQPRHRPGAQPVTPDPLDELRKDAHAIATEGEFVLDRRCAAALERVLELHDLLGNGPCTAATLRAALLGPQPPCPPL